MAAVRCEALETGGPEGRWVFGEVHFNKPDEVSLRLNWELGKD